MTAHGPLEFRPMQGLLNIGRIVAHRLGLAQYWDGDDNLEGVIRSKLQECGVPQKPIVLEGPQGLTPRQMAERSGFIRKRRRLQK